MITKRTLIAAGVSLVTGSSFAESLPQIVEAAVTNNPEVRAQLNNYLATEQQQEGARGGYRPRIDLEARAGQSRRDPPDAAADTFSNPSGIVELRQMLFDGFATSREVRRLGHVKARSFYELQSKADEVAVEATRAYVDVQRYRALGDLAMENWRVHKDVFDRLQQRAQAGVGRSVDFELAGGRLALAQSNWVTEQSNLHDVSARFRRVVGNPPPESLSAVPSLAKGIPAEGEVIKTAITNNPAYLGAVSNLRAARANTDVARSAMSPKLELRANHSVERNRLGLPGTETNSFAGLVLNYNFYNGGRDSARVSEGSSRFAEAIDLREKICRDIRQETAIAYNDTRRLNEQLSLLESHARAMEKARDAFRQQFDIGQRTLLDLLDTENELFQARRALTIARHDLQTAQARVLGQTHGLLAALGISKGAVEAPKEATAEEAPDDMGVVCDTSMPKMAAFTPGPLPTPRAIPAALPVAAAPEETLDCEATVNAWAQAWSNRDYKRYAGFYSSSFKPMTRRDLVDWRGYRSFRISKQSISVKLSDLTVRKPTATTCEAKFTQTYRSPDFSDVVQKTLRLTDEGASKWRIVQEITPRRAASN